MRQKLAEKSLGVCALQPDSPAGAVFSRRSSAKDRREAGCTVIAEGGLDNDAEAASGGFGRGEDPALFQFINDEIEVSGREIQRGTPSGGLVNTRRESRGGRSCSQRALRGLRRARRVGAFLATGSALPKLAGRHGRPGASRQERAGAVMPCSGREPLQCAELGLTRRGRGPLWRPRYE